MISRRPTTLTAPLAQLTAPLATLTAPLALLLIGLTGCDEGPPPGTGGTDVDAGTCGRGLVVASSDYHATNLSLVGVDGAILSSSFFSSGSPTLDPESHALALSGDVVQPTMPQQGDRVVAIDRNLGVLSFITVATGKLQSRLLIGEKVPLNLQDYAEVSAHKAYVPNLDPRLDPSLGPVEKGSNLVIVDPSVPAITGVVDLSPALSGEDPKFYPRPTRAVVSGARLHVLLTAHDLAFDDSAASRLVTIDTGTDAILTVTTLDGLHGCSGLALSPSGTRLAVTCSGKFHSIIAGTHPNATLDAAGLVLLSHADGDLVLEKTWPAASLGDGPLGFSASFVDEDRVAFTTFGQFAEGDRPARDDTFAVLDTTSSAVTVPLRTSDPFTIGEVRCLPACGACFVTRAHKGGAALHRFPLVGGLLAAGREITVDPAIGLPPRYLGQF